MFTSCKEFVQLQNWSKERHLILLIFCFIRGKCWPRGNIFDVVEQGKHFSKRSAPGYMLNGDLLKLFRIRTMARISHFVCLGKQFYHTHDLKCVEVFTFCIRSYFFVKIYMFFSTTYYFWKCESVFMLLTENILVLTSWSFFLLEEVMWQNNSHVFLMLGGMGVAFNYIFSFFIFFFLIPSQRY